MSKVRGEEGSKKNRIKLILNFEFRYAKGAEMLFENRKIRQKYNQKFKSAQQKSTEFKFFIF